MKYTKKNKKLLLVSIVLVIVTSMFLVLNNSHAYKELPKVKLKGDIKKSGLAIMVESDYNSGEYQKSDSNKFPTDGYTLNRIKSGCVDKNGNSVDALTYNGGNNGITIKTKQSVYCYLYYDNLFKGSGTEDSPYQINYIEDLVRLSNSVNIDQNNYQNKNFILMRDLDFNENDSYMKYNDTGFGDINGVSGIEGIKEELINQEGIGFIPIGENDNVHFQGNFDGNNKRLNNIFRHIKTTNQYLGGLFGRVENSIIKNLTISGNISSEVISLIGGITAETYGETIIENCVNEVNVESKVGNNSIGGFVAEVQNNTIIKNCTNKGRVSGSNNTGGLIGLLEANSTLTIENSHNEGTITNEVGSQAGGLLGRDAGATSKTIIKNSYNIGEITNAKTYEGGLVGFAYGILEIEKSYNEGKINSTLGTYIGGLIGYGVDTSNITINNSYNNNEVSINTPEEKNISIGGFIGDSLGNVNINNCFNTGNIVNERTDYAAGSFNGKTLNLGGFIGQLEGNKNTIIKNSYNTGEILNGNFSGGIVGNRSSTSNSNVLLINECYNIGKIDNNIISGWMGAQAGGIIGVNRRKMLILNSFNNGAINSTYQASGLVGDTADGSTYIMNSYNVGTLNGIRVYNSGISSIKFNSGMNYYANNVYNAGLMEATSNLYGLGYFAQTQSTAIKNAYYINNVTVGTNLENDGELTTSMAETDMKNKTFVNTLNKNVNELNNAKLETIDENLKGYELEKWIQGSDDYPILTRKIEDLSGHGNHGKSYAVKYDKEGITTSTDENHLGYIDAGLRGHDFGNNFTMVVKFKFNSILDYNNLFGNWETGGMGISIRNINGTMNIVDAIYTDKYYSFTKQYDFKENEWYTIILTYDGALASDNLKLYINGVLHDTINVTGDVKTPVGDTIVAFGGNPKATWIQGQYSYATYKESLIFDRALTEEKDHISTNYKDDINVTNQEELLVWYKF